MDKFKTISDYDIVRLAYGRILEKWAKEKAQKEKLNSEGKPSPIADHWIEKTEKQMEELHAWILKYEQERRNILAIPPADVKEVIHGTWEWDENGMDLGLGAWKCSECKAVPQTWWNTVRVNPLRCGGSRFCGDCGAEMRKLVEIDQFTGPIKKGDIREEV